MLIFIYMLLYNWSLLIYTDFWNIINHGKKKSGSIVLNVNKNKKIIINE